MSIAIVFCIVSLDNCHFVVDTHRLQLIYKVGYSNVMEESQEDYFLYMNCRSGCAYHILRVSSHSILSRVSFEAFARKASSVIQKSNYLTKKLLVFEHSTGFPLVVTSSESARKECIGGNKNLIELKH